MVVVALFWIRTGFFSKNKPPRYCPCFFVKSVEYFFLFCFVFVFAALDPHKDSVVAGSVISDSKKNKKKNIFLMTRLSPHSEPTNEWKKNKKKRKEKTIIIIIITPHYPKNQKKNVASCFGGGISTSLSKKEEEEKIIYHF